MSSQVRQGRAWTQHTRSHCSQSGVIRTDKQERGNGLWACADLQAYFSSDNHVAMGNGLHNSRPQFPHLYNGKDDCSFRSEL